MARVTYLSAANNRPLVKQFTDEGTQSYPRIKRVTSHTHDDVNDTASFEAYLRQHAELGHCLLKGQVDRPLEDESRKGQVDRDTPTDFLVLDFDGIYIDPDELQLPDVCNEQALGMVADYLVHQLPQPFRYTSYVAQASASFGLKRDSLSLHLFFLLGHSVHPRALREYVTSLNFDGGFFEARLKLSASGTALSYPIDRTIADNGRIVYVAPPTFKGEREDPFEDPNARILRFDKPQATLDLEQPLQAVDVEWVHERIKDKVKELRKAKGLKPRAERSQTLTINDFPVTVVTNPDRVRMIPAEDEGDFVRYNVNDGDSSAYWVFKFNPTIVYNFKGEPNFLFEKADPETFAWHLKEFAVENLVTEDGLKPLIFLDYSTAKYHYGLYDPQRDRMDSIYQCASSDLKHFLAQYGALMPETVPVWRYEFEPQETKVIDFEKRFLNRYEAPEHFRNPEEIDDRYLGVKIGYGGEALKTLCPTIWKLLENVTGCGVTEMEYFLNWLAFICQRRSKAMTAWVFHGVPGTGKGLLYNHVLAPLVGEKYAMMKRSQDLEEKFNQWMRHSLLFVVDEFRVENTQRSRQSDMINKIKNLITEPRGTIRSMGVDQQEVKLYANCIFFSNDHDAVRIQEGDRRFNIAPRQELPLIKRYPELLKGQTVKSECARELPRLARFLLEWDIDETAVILPLENQAKADMREASSDSADLFVRAVLEGDLDYFLPVLDEPLRIGGDDYTLAAKNLVKAIVRDYRENEETRMFISELRPLYNVLCGKAENEHKFGKLLSRHGLRAVQLRRGHTKKRGVSIVWKLKENDINAVRAEYITADDRRFEAIAS